MRITLFISCFLPPQYLICFNAAAAAAKSLQLCQTLWDPTDSNPPGFPIPGILQERALECFHFLLQCMKVKSESEVAQLCSTLATPWTAAYQARLSMGFSRQKYWSGVPLPPRNMLSRLVITFLLRSKRLLISWLQSWSTVILKPRKIKSATVSTVSPSICHEVMGPDAMILVFWLLSIKH